MNKLSMVLATLVALLGATASWAQDTEESEPAAALVAPVAEPAGCDTSCCEQQDTCRSRCRDRVTTFFERAGCFCARKERNACCTDCDQGCEKSCEKSCGKRCSLQSIREWLCFRRETVCCPKGPARRLPPLYTFFPCDDCGDGGACANNDCCNTCNK
jgi:hypothetical protein